MSLVWGSTNCGNFGGVSCRFELKKGGKKVKGKRELPVPFC